MAKADRTSDARQEAFVEDIYPNPWNVNSMSPREFENLKASIRRYGFTIPVVVRQHPDLMGKWEIVDGEHRWRAAKVLSLHQVPIVVTQFDDATAKEAGLVLNELHGQPDPAKLASIIQELERQSADFESFREAIPFSQERLDELLGRFQVDYDSLDKPKPKSPEEKPAERWVERVYRMPSEAAVVVDEAVGKLKEMEDFEHDWQALEVMAAEVMAS